MQNYGDQVRAELAAYTALEKLDAGGRAVLWLAGCLEVDLSEYDQVAAREAA